MNHSILFLLVNVIQILSVQGGQCDVVVTSQAALKNDIKAALNNLDVKVNGNNSCCSQTCEGIERRIYELEDELDGKLNNILDKKLNEILDEKLGAMLDNIQQTVTTLVESSAMQLNHSHASGILPNHPAASCADILRNFPNFPSGYYWIEGNGRQYCDMTRSCGGVTGGWMRVAHLDMTNNSHQCPSGLRQRTDSNKRTCVKNSDPMGCSSVTFSTATLGYSKVCGKIIAYQFGDPDAFGQLWDRHPLTIDTHYVDGISLTHGNPRHHLWTFAASPSEAGVTPHYCPCINNINPGPPPSFVGNDYFCDTAPEQYRGYIFYSDDPLWDGAGCGPQSTCCSFNNPPWFYKQLPRSTTDDIEMRVCRNEVPLTEDIAIESVEIYVQDG